jgi:hypothetical protein
MTIKLFDTTKWVASGVIEASPDDVFEVMLNHYRVNGALPVNTHYFEANLEARQVILRGHYWYEGIFRAEPHAEGTLLTYRVNNIGPQSTIMPRVSKWMVPIWQHNLPKEIKNTLKNSLQDIGDKLQSPFHMIES